jgi:hypothetical protein
MAADGVKDSGLSLYKTFYRQASSMHHMDITGVIASVDDDMNSITAPSWEHLDDALVAAGSVLRYVTYYDEMAKVGLRERLQNGPNQAYVDACKIFRDREERWQFYLFRFPVLRGGRDALGFVFPAAISPEHGVHPRRGLSA